jgi:hypothetical protein
LLVCEEAEEDGGTKKSTARVEPFTTIIVPETSQQQLDELFAKSVENYNNFNVFSCMTGFYKLCLVTGTNERYIQSLFNMACAFHMIDLFSLAVHYLRSLLEIRSDTTAHQVLWAIAQSGKINEIVLDTYRHLIDLRGDVFARQKLTLMTGSGEESIKSDPKYIEMVYDNLADAFENRLVKVLGYDAPWSMYKVWYVIVKYDYGKSLRKQKGKHRPILFAPM